MKYSHLLQISHFKDSFVLSEKPQ